MEGSTTLTRLAVPSTPSLEVISHSELHQQHQMSYELCHMTLQVITFLLQLNKRTQLLTPFYYFVGDPIPAKQQKRYC